MGYLLSSLAQLPVDSDVTLYIFVIDSDWEESRGESLKRNFPQIAKRLGSHAVIATGLSESWNNEVSRQILGKSHSDLSKLLPAPLLTDSHPDHLQDDSMRLLVPLEHAEQQFGGLGPFFSALTQFAQDRNSEFVKRFEEESAAIKIAREANAVIQLKPSFFGLGVNVNALLDKLISKPKLGSA